MAFFDSAKNRALWQNELEKLNAEREKRESGEYVPGGRHADASNTAPGVQRINFAQLEREERQAKGIPEPKKDITPMKQHEKAAPVKQASFSKG